MYLLTPSSQAFSLGRKNTFCREFTCTFGLRGLEIPKNEYGELSSYLFFSYCGEMCWKNRTLQQTQFTGAGDGFGATLNLQFVKNLAVMPFDRVQGEEKPLAYLSIR